MRQFLEQELSSSKTQIDVPHFQNLKQSLFNPPASQHMSPQVTITQNPMAPHTYQPITQPQCHPMQNWKNYYYLMSKVCPQAWVAIADTNSITFWRNMYKTKLLLNNVLPRNMD